MSVNRRIFCLTAEIFLFVVTCHAQVSVKDTILNGMKISFVGISEHHYDSVSQAQDLECSIFEGCDSLEKEIVAKYPEFIKREKWKLFLKLANGKDALLCDSLMTDNYEYILNDSMWNAVAASQRSIYTKFQLIDYFEDIGYYFLIEYLYEGYSYLMVNRRNGNRTYFEYMSRFPQFNARKNKVVFCSDGWPYQSFSGYKVMSIYPDSIPEDWTLEYPPDGWLPRECKWVDDHTFYAKEIQYPVPGSSQYNSGNWDYEDFEKRCYIIKF